MKPKDYSLCQPFTSIPPKNRLVPAVKMEYMGDFLVTSGKQMKAGLGPRCTILRKCCQIPSLDLLI